MDKTRLIYELARRQCQRFLARPRGFGKTLLVSTLARLFAGHRALFEGLAIADLPWEWEAWPVLYFNFSQIDADTPGGFKEGLMEAITAQAPADMAISKTGVRKAMWDLVRSISTHSGQGVVLLVDEYDSPLHRCIDRPKDFEAVAGVLEDFFVITKNYPDLFRFVFVTGVTRFSKVSLFSGVAEITDISLWPQYAALCGFTQRELEAQFAPYIARLAAAKHLGYDACMRRMAELYDGYSFSLDAAAERVYCPRCIARLFRDNDFNMYLYPETTPRFVTTCPLMGRLLQWDRERVYVNRDDMNKDFQSMSTPAVLLYQTGFLTIMDYDTDARRVALGFPNRDAFDAYYSILLPRALCVNSDNGLSALFAQIRDRVFQGEPDGLVGSLNTLFARYNYPSNRRRIDSEQQLQYAVLTPLFLLDVATVPEHPAGDGRCDIVVYAPLLIWVIELKVNRTAAEGMRQISARHYWEGFERQRGTLMLLSMNYSTETRRISQYIPHRVTSGDPGTYPPEQPGHARLPPWENAPLPVVLQAVEDA